MMKKFTKILICIMCSFTIVISYIGVVFADVDDVMFDLSSLGVMEDMEKPSDVNDYMTRAEFSQLVINAMGHNEIADTMRDKGYFSDVSSTPYVGAINLLYELNVISGTGINTFSPEAYVTYPQIGKMMVNVLGYSNIVEGNELNSYFYLAGVLGVYKNTLQAGEYVTYRDAYVIINNCLNIDLMTENFGMLVQEVMK